MNLPEDIEHDGTGCPLPLGTEVLVTTRNGRSDRVVVTARSHDPMMGHPYNINAWYWSVNGRQPHQEYTDIARYRIIGVPGEELYPVTEAHRHV